MNVSGTLPAIYREQGWTLEEPDTHLLELRQHGQTVAVFAQSGATIPEIMAEIRRHESTAATAKGGRH